MTKTNTTGWRPTTPLKNNNITYTFKPNGKTFCESCKTYVNESPKNKAKGWMCRECRRKQ